MEKKGKYVRIFFNNCNGLQVNKLITSKMIQKKTKKDKKFLGRTTSDSKAEKMIDQMCNWKIDLVCLSETNVAWENDTARRVFNLIKYPYDKRSCWITSSSITPTPSLVKPGGTAMLVDSKYTGKIVDRGADWTRMGRWTYVTLNGRNGTRVTIVTGYRCGSVKIDQVGSSTAIAQQYGISRQRGNKNPNPYIDFLTDIKNG